jgi:hypothetical protein
MLVDSGKLCFLRNKNLTLCDDAPSVFCLKEFNQNGENEENKTFHTYGPSNHQQPCSCVFAAFDYLVLRKGKKK